MCLSGEVSDNWPPLIEFIVFLIFGGLDIGAHYGVYLISKTEIFDITRHAVYNVSRPNNTLSTLNYTLTTLNNTINATLSGSNRTIMNNTNISPFMNITRSPEELWADLIEFRKLYFYAWIIGAVIFGIQVCWLLPNVVKHIMSADPAVLKDGSAPWYYRNVFTVHVLFLLLGTFLFDIPISCLTMEMLSLVWKGEALTAQEKLSASETMFTLSLVGLAFIAFYKGMMPLFLWVGNPFCFPCVPLRLLIVFPGGLVAMVMIFTPAMGVAKNGLLTFAPPEMQALIGGVAGSFFQIGLIVWGLFFIIIIVITCFYCKFCRDDDAKLCCCC